jgi:hypothetical protein
MGAGAMVDPPAGRDVEAELVRCVRKMQRLLLVAMGARDAGVLHRLVGGDAWYEAIEDGNDVLARVEGKD